MRSTAQRDLIRESDPAKARAFREAAATARVDIYWTPAERERRAAYYEAEARKYEPITEELT